MTRGTCDRVFPRGGPEKGVPGCGQPIEWARTVASPTSPGRKRMPLDLTRYDVDDERANVAEVPSHTGPYCRVITRAEPLREGERRRMSHFATCPVLNPALSPATPTTDDYEEQ